MNTRKLASNVKNICARRRETWKKSYKVMVSPIQKFYQGFETLFGLVEWCVDQSQSFSKSTHSQDPESVYAGPKERDEACQWIHHQGMLFSIDKNQCISAKFRTQESSGQLEPLEISFESSIIAGSSWYNGDSLCAIWSGIIYNEG